MTEMRGRGFGLHGGGVGVRAIVLQGAGLNVSA